VLVRLIGLATAIALGVLILAWLVTGQRKWLRHAWLLFRVALCVIVLALLLFFVEAALAGRILAVTAAWPARPLPERRASRHEVLSRIRAYLRINAHFCASQQLRFVARLVAPSRKLN
jgi:uncharacterized membrane protein